MVRLFPFCACVRVKVNYPIPCNPPRLVSGAWEVVSNLDLPVAIVAGRTAPFGPVEFAVTVAQALPKGTLIERRHLGHFGPLENPKDMAQDVAEWVATHSATS